MEIASIRNISSPVPSTLGRQSKGKTGHGWFTRLAKLPSSRLNEKLFLSKLSGEKLRKTFNINFQPPHAYTWIHLCIHMHVTTHIHMHVSKSIGNNKQHMFGRSYTKLRITQMISVKNRKKTRYQLLPVLLEIAPKYWEQHDKRSKERVSDRKRRGQNILIYRWYASRHITLSQRTLKTDKHFW